MKQLIISLLALFTLSTGFGQSINITGTVNDQEGKAAEYASVRLFSSEDSTVVTGAYTDAAGSFSLEKVTRGMYYLKITYPSHAPYDHGVIRVDSRSSDMNLGLIAMKLDKSIDLDEVTATGSLDILKAGIDKKVYSVEQDISVRGGTANDVLNNIPSIDIDQDGNISLRGDGNVTVLIDGRPSALVKGDGQNLLDALPANSIERIEVVTNPSAKYDPDGTSGIINIVLKKNRLRGWNGSVSATGATGNLLDASASLNFRGSKVSTYLNYSLNFYEGYRNYYGDLLQEFGSDSSNLLNQSREGTDFKFSNSAVFGMDFDLNERNKLGFSVTGVYNRRARTGDLESRVYDQNNVLFQRWDRISYDPRKSLNADLNLGYAHTFKDEKGEWSWNANQSIGDRNVQGFYRELYRNPDESLTGQPALVQQLENKTEDRITTIQTDMNYIIKDWKARIETGAKAILRSDNLTTYSEAFDTINQVFVEDTLANFDYDYQEQIYSIYGIFGQELGKWSYQGGLRGEYALQIPNLVSTGQLFRNEYINVFPSAHVKFQASKKSQFSLSYSKRINRAKSRQLNPFTSYANPLNLRSGNPELQPEYIDSYDLGYSFTTKKVILTTSIFHRRTRDVINRVKEFYPNNVSIVTYENIDRSVSTGLEAVLIYKPAKWIRNTLSVNANHIDYTNLDTTADWSNDGFNWNMKYAVNIDFWKKTATIQVNAQYNAPRVTPQGLVTRRGAVDISAEKRLLDKRLTVGMRVTDVFDAKGFDLDLSQEGVRQVSEYKWLTRRFFITASYRFGKLDTKVKQPRRSPSVGGDGL